MRHVNPIVRLYWCQRNFIFKSFDFNQNLCQKPITEIQIENETFLIYLTHTRVRF